MAPPNRQSLDPISWAWPAALATATIFGTIVTACMMPFVAVAVAAASTMTVRPAIVTILAVWLANQLLGFTLAGFPWTPFAFAWGGALGVASLAALAVAKSVTAGGPSLVAARLAAAFIAAFIGYEVLLLAFAAMAGGLETFAPGIVAQLAANDLIWFGCLLGLRILLTRSAPRWFGPAPALRFAR